MAGRNISTTHVGFGAPRVQKTTGQMGVAVGAGAYVAAKYAIAPREALARHQQELLDDVFNGYSDAIPTIVVDDSSATKTGSWTSVPAPAGYASKGYVTASAGNSASVSFIPDLPLAGRYWIYLWWTSGSDRTTNVSLSLKTGSTSYDAKLPRVNQRVRGGQWISLGAFNLLAGKVTNLTISNSGADGLVIADAVRFEPQVATPSIAPAGGTFAGPVAAVNIVTTTPGSTIYCSLDGSYPSQSITSPIQVTPPATVRCFAKHAGASDSAMVSARFDVRP
jgi:hypothetical protein